MLRLPLQVFSALCCAVGYLLLIRLFDWRLALLASLFWAFDPFFIAHSQVLHTDAPVSELAYLTLLVALLALGLGRQDEPQEQLAAEAPQEEYSEEKEETEFVADEEQDDEPEEQQEALGSNAGQTIANMRWWLLAGALFGFTVLAKLNGVLVGGAIVLLILLLHRADWRSPRWWLDFARVMAIFGFVALVVFVIAYPAMWVAPRTTFLSMFDRAEGVVDAGHLQFFMGQISEDPGLLYYLVTTAFRVTPFVLVGLVLAVPAFFSADLRRYRPVLLALLLSIAIFLVVTSLQAKKQDRYMLPIFPALDLFAAVGYLWLAKIIMPRVTLPDRVTTSPWATVGAYVAAGVVLAIPVVSSAPYTLDYYNPLLGGLPAATRSILVGWGEGLDQAGAFITQDSGGMCRYVFAVYSDNIEPYIPCEARPPSACVAAQVADSPQEMYSVVYLSHLQRQVSNPYYDAAQGVTPRFTARIQGVDFAYVYRVEDLNLDVLRQGGQNCDSG
jgi:4-amino-4-deoxy-L-arabinose transferase-like glycosyltransferase